MVGCHPEMLGLAELNLFACETVGELNGLHSGRERTRHGLLRSLSHLAFGEQTEETVALALQWLAENAAMSTVELFRTMQAWVSGRGLIDKSPLHVHIPAALRRMARTDPDARFLHLTRHPSDNINSILRLWQTLRAMPKERFPTARLAPQQLAEPQGADKLWLEPHRNILEFLADVPAHRKMQLRGEDLLSDPVEHALRIAEWLEIDTGVDAVAAMLRPDKSPFAAYGPPNARYGNDPDFLQSPRLRPFTLRQQSLKWERPDGTVREFSEALQACAKAFGY